MTDRQCWKEFARRSSGPDTYQFGDVTRALTKRIVPRLRWRSPQLSRQPEPVDESAADPETKRSDPGTKRSTNPFDHAQRGVETLRVGCCMFDDLDLPLGAPALQKIREGLAELECSIQESVEWEQRCPNSAPLERTQVCFAAGEEHPPEWSMGQLYESSDTLLFESSEQPPWRIGPVRWDEIASLEELCPSGSDPASSSDIRLVIRNGATHLFSGLSNVDGLTELGGLSAARMEELPRGAETVTGCDAEQAVVAAEISPQSWLNQWSDQSLRTASSSYSATSMVVVDASPEAAPSNELSFRPPSMGTDGTFFPAADALPQTVSNPLEPTFSKLLPTADFKEIKRILRLNENWPLRLFFEQEMAATDIRETSWAASQRITGTMVRRLKFQLPVPDVPQVVRRLVALPKKTEVTHLSRLGSSPDRIILVQEACSHDVTYGEHFWVQDVLVFSRGPEGGVLFEKFAEVKWVKALPWMASALTTFIEMSAVDHAKKAGTNLVRFLENEGYLTSTSQQT